MPKVAFRQRLLGQRRSLSTDQRTFLSGLIQQRLMAEPEFCRARTIALYSPIDQEVDTGQLAAWGLSEGRRVAYPRMVGDRLEFLAVAGPAELVVGRFGVREPPGGDPLPLAEIDVLVVPGVGFDEDGCRLGYGRGFYDRVLHGLAPATWAVGLGYEFQVMATLPRFPHDQSLHALITERRVCRFAPAIPVSR